mgnify:CR=1 FL=1
MEKEEIKRPDIEFAKLETTADTAQLCEKQVKEYETWVETLELDQLKEEEQNIIAIINEHEQILKEKKYPLGKKVSFEGRVYTKDKVCGFIREVLNKREVEYNYTLGLYQMYRYWENPGNEVDYTVLDNTLRTLENGGTKFKGVGEWEKVLVINEYFKENNNDLTMDFLQGIYYAHLHNKLITRIQLLSPVKSEEDEAKEGPVEIVGA